MRSVIGKGIAATLMAALFTSAAQAGIKADDLNIGVDPNLGQLVIIWSGDQVELPPINGPLFGFGADEPGLITLEDAFGDLVPPETGANLVLEVIFFDPALKGREPAFGPVFRNPGDTWDIGPVPAHEHPFWHIDSTDGGYVPPPGQTEWNATFRILDTGSTDYLPSEAVTVTFTPEPASLAMLLVISALSRRVAPRKVR